MEEGGDLRLDGLVGLGIIGAAVILAAELVEQADVDVVADAEAEDTSVELVTRFRGREDVHRSSHARHSLQRTRYFSSPPAGLIR
jgi:hypothetical protein